METTSAATPASTPSETPASTPAETPVEGEAPASLEEVAALEKEVAATEAAAKKLGKKKLNLKVDGRDEEMEIDLDDEEGLRKHLQMSKVAQKRMQEKAEYEKNMKAFVHALKTNPMAVLSDPQLLGNDKLREFANAIVNNELAEMQKTPEQREKEKLQKELETLKAQHEADKKSREEAEFKRMQSQAAHQFDKDITEALSTSGLPKSPYTVKRMAEVMMLAYQNDIKISAQDAVGLVKKQTLSDFREMIGALPDDGLEEWMGKEGISRIRKRSLQRLKQAAPSVAEIKPTGGDVKQEAQKKTEKVSSKDFFKNLGK